MIPAGVSAPCFITDQGRNTVDPPPPLASVASVGPTAPVHAQEPHLWVLECAEPRSVARCASSPKREFPFRVGSRRLPDDSPVSRLGDNAGLQAVRPSHLFGASRPIGDGSLVEISRQRRVSHSAEMASSAHERVRRGCRRYVRCLALALTNAGCRRPGPDLTALAKLWSLAAMPVPRRQDSANGTPPASDLTDGAPHGTTLLRDRHICTNCSPPGDDSDRQGNPADRRRPTRRRHLGWP